MFDIIGLDHVALGVNDLEKSIQWYQRVLGLKELRDEAWGPFPVFMISPNQTGLALFPSEKGNPIQMPEDRRSGLPHFAFRVNHSNFGKAQRHLNQLSVEFDFQDHHNAHSIYFRDLDNYCIEITTYDL